MCEQQGKKILLFQCLSNIGWLNKNRSAEHFLYNSIQQMLIKSLLWAMCCAKWWKKKAKIKSLTIKRFHFWKDTNRERGHFSALSGVEKYVQCIIGLYEKGIGITAKCIFSHFFCSMFNTYTMTKMVSFPWLKKHKPDAFFPSHKGSLDCPTLDIIHLCHNIFYETHLHFV